ncbi:MAG TPA: NACHT domain-containing protein [Bryobacteraceae bacterium]|jgi:hypothetical protein
MNGATFDVDSAVAYLIKRTAAFFGPDEISGEIDELLRNHINLGLREAALVQCVGMNEPVELLHLYQPTRFKDSPLRLGAMVDEAKDSVVFAGPGQGKTTLLKYLLLSQASQERFVPMLFTLRTEGSAEILATIVDILDRRRRHYRVPPSPTQLLLLVDGYDEITDSKQNQVSELLKKFIAVRCGFFVLACRAGYQVRELKARECVLAEFDREDGTRFVDAFAKALRVGVDGAKLIDELEKRKLTYIASHPLMLTLVCVVKSRTKPELPHNSVELLRQAIETLSFRWDEAKGVVRSSQAGLLSIHILECAMRVAYDMGGLKVPMSEVLGIVKHSLTLLHRSDVFPEKVIDDIKRFFGLLTTTPDGQCQFVHKTVQDYLAARFEVENSLFKPARVEKWDMRAAYAACMVHDGTLSMHNALVNSESIEAFRECLANGARFDPDMAANAVFIHFDRYRRAYTYTPSTGTIRASTRSDFFDLADDTFLDSIVRKAPLATHTTGLEVVLLYCLAEFVKRRRRVPDAARGTIGAIFRAAATVELLRSGRTETIRIGDALALP